MSAVKGLLAAVVLAASTTPAWGQVTPAPSAPAAATAPPRVESPSQGSPVDLTVGGVMFGSASLGGTSADLLAPNGSPLVLFKLDKRLSPGVGLDLSVGLRLTRWLAAEATGTWSHAQFRGRVSEDFEGADDVTLAATVTRFDLRGSAVITLKSTAKTALFLRVGGGWMREVAEGESLLGDGVVANVGGGMKYWWRNRTTGRLSRIGLRIEGHVEGLKRGIQIGARTLLIVPSVSTGLVLGL